MCAREQQKDYLVTFSKRFFVSEVYTLFRHLQSASDYAAMCKKSAKPKKKQQGNLKISKQVKYPYEDQADILRERVIKITKRLRENNEEFAKLWAELKKKNDEVMRLKRLELEAGFIPTTENLLGTDPEYLGIFIHANNRHLCVCNTITPCHMHFLASKEVITIS